MANKEVLVANLRHQIDDLSKIPEGIKKTQNEIEELIAQMQDESRTGTPPTFDLGSEKYSEVLVKIVQELKKNIVALKKAGDFIQSFQKKLSVKMTSDTQEFDKN